MHFVRDVKRDGRYKSRLVAGDHKQRPGVDFNETLAPVCSYQTLRIMAVAVHADLTLQQFDIKTAFLHGHLKEEVYVRLPRGWEHLAGCPGHVLRLRRALYGLRQALRAWSERLMTELTARRILQSDADPSLWILYGEGGAILTMFYVDDGMVAARTHAEADALVDLIGSVFEVRKLGEPQDMLGIEISRDRQAGTINIPQSAKARGLAAAFVVEGRKRTTPMTPAVYGELRAARNGDKMADQERYMSGIGSLLHLAQCVRPDIAAPVGALAAYNSAPTLAHCEAMLDVICYVASTAERGITYGRSGTPKDIWCHANFAECPDTRRSVRGLGCSCFGGAVSWESCKQVTAAASTMDAEYQAYGAVMREALPLRKLLRELAILCQALWPEEATTILCDNKAAVSLCCDRKEAKRAKHIDIVHHFAHDRVASGDVKFVYCRSDNNVSDCLTKALPRPLLEAGLKVMGMMGD
jgi:hypothetical protein